ncbi:MAG: hypothetical protein ACOYLX_12245 [Burkholderiaceae bacterium]
MSVSMLPATIVATVDQARAQAWASLTPGFRALLLRKAGVTMPPTVELRELLPADAEAIQAALGEFVRQAEVARRCLGWRARQGRAA